jgi:hypothetical protein
MQQPASQGRQSLIQRRSDVEMLTDNRRELQRQAEELSGRRNVLYAQLRNTTDPGARRELESRMSEIDGRLSTLDGQIARLNEQISEAISGRGGNAPVVVDVPRIVRGGEIRIPSVVGGGGPRGPDMRQIAGVMAAEALVFGLIGFAFWRFGVRRMREQFERAFSSQSGQINQLQNAVDVIGVEVERISEGQRYVAKVLSEGSPAATALSPQQQERVR